MTCLCALPGAQWFFSRQEKTAHLASETFAEFKDGRRIRYRLNVGDRAGPTILLVAGLGATVEDWKSLMDALPASASTLSYDRAGIGLSDPAEVPMSAESAVRDISELLDTLSIDGKVAPVCFSLGGLICHVLAARYPERIAGLVFLDPTSPDEWTSVSKTAADREKLQFLTQIPRHALTTKLGLSRLKHWLNGKPVAKFDMSTSHQEGIARESSAIYVLHDEVRAVPLPRQLPLTVISAGRPNSSDIKIVQSLHRRWSEQSALGRHVVIAGANHVSLRDDPSSATVVAELIQLVVSRPGG